MNYTVVWKPAAEAALTRIWTGDAERAAVTGAADSIDRLLAASPLDVGESREDVTRILILLPLSVYYVVLEQDRRVEVFAVWRVSKPRP